MKKLRMIINSVVVLAIVSSTFAFNAKQGSFCVLDPNTSGDNCTTYLSGDKKITTGIGTQWKYYPNWACDKAQCTAASNHLCTATVTLISD